MYTNTFYINQNGNNDLNEVTISWVDPNYDFDPPWCIYKALGQFGSNGLNDEANNIWLFGDITETTFKMLHAGYNENYTQEYWNTGDIIMIIGIPLNRIHYHYNY